MNLVDVRPLRSDEWREAMQLTARAFLYEPFIIGLFGADPVERFPRVVDAYSEAPFNPDSLGAFSGAVLIGAIGVERSGQCHQCAAAAHLDSAGLYQRNATAAHLRVDPDHGWVGRVAVEPVVHGQRIGAVLVDAALAHLQSIGTPVALLDCELHRVSYYETKGFTVLEEFDGSVSNRLALMRAHTGARS